MLTTKDLVRHIHFFVLTTKAIDIPLFWLCLQQRIQTCIHSDWSCKKGSGQAYTLFCAYNKGSRHAFILVMLTTKELVRHILFLCLQQMLQACIYSGCAYDKGSGQQYTLFCAYNKGSKHASNLVVLTTKDLVRHIFCVCLQQRLHTDKHSFYVLITKALYRHVFFLCANNKGSIQTSILFMCLQQRLYTGKHSFYVLITKALYRQALFFVY